MTSQPEFPYTYDGLSQILKRLRGPGGCPWDRQQTHESLKAGLLEECYELIEAIEQSDGGKLVEELGDVLLHLLFQIHVGEDAGEFTERQVYQAQIEKLIRRHPHVFGDVKVSGAEEVVSNWQAIKQQERAGSDRSVLDGAPKQMPALAYAQEIHSRAARTGFDWNDFQGVLDKVGEELRELEAAQSDEEREREFGDLLASIVNAARWLEVDAEAALRQANGRFYRRFVTMERLAKERGLAFAELLLDEKEALWQEAKRLE